MTATFSREEAARLAAFDAAPDAPESHAATVERMARAMYDAAMVRAMRAAGAQAEWRSRWDEAPDITRWWYLDVAEAALRVVTEPADPT